MQPKNETVYLIRPIYGGFANDTIIRLENGPVLYHVRSKVFAPWGREYTVYDDSMHELVRTEQEHTALFPRHAILHNNIHVGRLGQVGILPIKYFIHLQGLPRAEVHLGGADQIFPLHAGDEIIADIASAFSTWIVVIPKAEDHLMLLSAIAIVYRESSIGG